MPQIMQGCGIVFLYRQDLWAYNGGDLSRTTLLQEGIDGSSVLVHLTNEYNSRPIGDAGAALDATRPRTTSPRAWCLLGGVTAAASRDHLSTWPAARAGRMPLTRMAPPQAYFDDLLGAACPPRGTSAAVFSATGAR